MRLFVKLLFISCSILMAGCNLCTAQTKKNKPAPKKAETKEEEIIPPAEKPEQKKGTPRIIYETIPAKEKPQAIEIETNALTRPKEKTIVVSEAPKKEIPKGNFKIVYDTTKQKADQASSPLSSKDTVIVMKSARKKPDIRDTIISNEIDNTLIKNPKGSSREILIDNKYCGCMDMNIKAQDTIRYEDYVNYSFKFKNNCKESVWINSGSFSFTVVNVFGYPVKELRKVDYVKRFEYPEYVKLLPGETFEFNLADDPFFQYNMGKSEKYKFRFTYNNTSHKWRAAPNKTYLCTRFEDKEVYVK